MPSPRYFFAAATGADGRIYAMGGLPFTNESRGVLNSVDAYNPLPPTTTTMDLALSAPTTLSVVGGDYAPNPFELVATVTNKGAIPAKDVTLVLYLPAGLSLATGSATQVIGDLPVGQHAQFTWSVEADGQQQATTLAYFASALASNAKATNTPRQITLLDGALTLKSIASNVGGDAGPVTATIHGGGFFDGATVKLVKGGHAIGGNDVVVTSDGLSITTTFDLTGQSRGEWDVVVTNPDGRFASLPGAFTIEEARAPELSMDVLGPAVIRQGRKTTFYIVYANQGNVDAGGIVFSITVPSFVAVEIDVPELIYDREDTGNEVHLSLVKVPVPPGPNGGIRITLLTLVAEAPPFTLSVRASFPSPTP